MIWILVLTLLVRAQNSPSSITLHGSTAALRVDASRPLEAVAVILGANYSWRVNVEDPPYLFAEDLRDRTAEINGAQRPPIPIVVPKGGELTVEYSVDENGRPQDRDAVLRQIVERYNSRFPFRYRLDRRDDVYTFIPVEARDREGRPYRIDPLLDHRLAFSVDEPGSSEAFARFAEALARESKARVACCSDGVVEHVLWRRPVHQSYEGTARDILRQLVGGGEAQACWTVRYDPVRTRWIIDLRLIASTSGRRVLRLAPDELR